MCLTILSRKVIKATFTRLLFVLENNSDTCFTGRSQTCLCQEAIRKRTMLNFIRLNVAVVIFSKIAVYSQSKEIVYIEPCLFRCRKKYSNFHSVFSCTSFKTFACDQ